MFYNISVVYTTFIKNYLISSQTISEAIKIPAQEATNGVDDGIILLNCISSPFLVVIFSTSESFSCTKGFSSLVTTFIPYVILCFFN